MTVLGRGLIFQSVLTSLHYTQACSYKNDTVNTLEGENGHDIKVIKTTTKKQRETETDRQTERQRQTETETETGTQKDRDRKTDRNKDRNKDKLKDNDRQRKRGSKDMKTESQRFKTPHSAMTTILNKFIIQHTSTRQYTQQIHNNNTTNTQRDKTEVSHASL